MYEMNKIDFIILNSVSIQINLSKKKGHRFLFSFIMMYEKYEKSFYFIYNLMKTFL